MEKTYMKLSLLLLLTSLFSVISCGDETADTADTADTAESSFCDNSDDYGLTFTRFITREGSDEGCPMLSPEEFQSNDDDEDDDGIQTCVSTIEDNPASYCVAAIRCTSTQADGSTFETQGVLDFEENSSFTGVIEFEINEVFCSYAVAGQAEAN